MDPEVIERLLLDRALGQLPVDAATLLDAYLAQNQDAAQATRAFEPAVGLARKVLVTQAAVAMPPFPAARISSATQRRLRFRVIKNVGALAALWLLGVGVGTRWSVSPDTTNFRQPEHTIPIVETHLASQRSTGDDFWSAARLYQTACNAKHAETAKIVWNSPLENPKLRGEL